METHRTRVRVRYAETDQMGVVYHANYIIWMEVGRVEFCRAAGLSYRDMEHDGALHLAVIEVNCRYISPARYDDEIDIETHIEKATARGVHFGYTMHHSDSGRKLAEGSSRHLFLDRSLRPMRLPERFFVQFGLPAPKLV
jgi:acyl-CoA thioester hydrolase